MFDSGNGFQSEVYANIPSMALMFAMTSPVFGNTGFVIQPASPGIVQDGFPSVPYQPLEAYIYQQQNSAPQISPTMILGGQNTGQQVISSSQVGNDSTGTPRVINGSQQINS
jgi:hypothetical protein